MLLFVGIILSTAGCTSNNTYKDDPFVGTWVWHNSDDLYMIIEVNSDGTSTTSALIAGEYYLHEDPWNHISNNTYGVGITDPFYVTIASNGTTLISEDTPNIVFVKDDDYVIPTPPPTIINPTPTHTATPTHTVTPTVTKTVVPTESIDVANEQAVKKAKSYLSYTSFSYQGLVEQLEYEGFTHTQAVYGADQNFK